MNFIKQIGAFEQWTETNYLPSLSQLLWYKLFILCNRAGWPEWVTVGNQRLMMAIQTSSQHTFLRARDKLIESGLVYFEKGKKGAPGRYKMVCLYGDSAVYSAKNAPKTTPYAALQTAPKTTPNVAPIYKQNKTKQNVSPSVSSPVPYDRIIFEYLRICTSYPRITKLSETRRKAIHARMTSGYTFEDFVRVFEKAEASSFLKGKNNRNWSANFDWMIKDANMAKILDGNYDDKETHAAISGRLDDLDEYF